jgi:hypothetical protein
MKKVYICSPYRGDVTQNEENARKYCRMAVDDGFLPVAPHIYFTQFLDDADDKQRVMGMSAGMQLLMECSELWVFGAPTEGMLKEIECAEKNFIPVIYR